MSRMSEAEYLGSDTISEMMKRIDGMFERYFKAAEMDQKPARVDKPVPGVVKPRYRKNYSIACRVAHAWTWHQKMNKSMREAAKRFDVPRERLISYNRRRKASER